MKITLSYSVLDENRLCRLRTWRERCAFVIEEFHAQIASLNLCCCAKPCKSGGREVGYAGETWSCKWGNKKTFPFQRLGCRLERERSSENNS